MFGAHNVICDRRLYSACFFGLQRFIYMMLLKGSFHGIVLRYAHGFCIIFFFCTENKEKDFFFVRWLGRTTIFFFHFDFIVRLHSISAFLHCVPLYVSKVWDGRVPTFSVKHGYNCLSTFMSTCHFYSKFIDDQTRQANAKWVFLSQN